MLTEHLYKTGIWCHQWDKITDSDETVMLLMLLTCKKKQQEFFPFVSSESKHMVKARGERVWQGRAQENGHFLYFFLCWVFPFLFSYKEAGLFSLKAEIGCNFHGQQILHVWYKQ